MLKKKVRGHTSLTFAKHEEDTHKDERLWPDGKLVIFLNENERVIARQLKPH